MAAAEARMAQQRCRCYVHEGAGEASKFSCYPLSSSSSSAYSSKSEFDHGPNTAAKEPQNAGPDYLSAYPSSYALTNRRWWLNQEPNFGRFKEFMAEHNISSGAELEILRSGLMKSDVSSSMDQVKALTCDSPEKNATGKNVTDLWYLDDHLMNLDSLNCLVSSEETKKPSSDFESQSIGSNKTEPLCEETTKLYSDFESHSLGSDKTEPWWRTAGKDDLASLVAQKSFEHIENCDLPQPRAMNYRKLQSACLQSFDHANRLALPLDQMAERGLSNLEYTQGTPKSGCSPHDSEQTFSSGGHSTTGIDKTDAPTNSENDQNKAQLLKALCLSQKRAREAEDVAKQAYNEKEHIITLLFRQASQLFAYKQWLQLLQLENICLQLKSKNQPICNLFPSVSPWAPCKGGRQVKKGQHWARRKRHGKPKYDFSKCAVAFAVGLGLASTGLFLGWTMGWLFLNV